MSETTRADAPPPQEPTTLSPGPKPRLPEIPGPWETAVAVWRRLRKMSTALMLLFTLTAVTVVATFIPQEPLIPSTVRDWRSGEAGPGEAVSRILDSMGLYDVFGTWWFALLVALLFVSLTGCLVPRWRAFARIVRRPPTAGRHLDLLSQRHELTTALPVDAALTAAERVLRRRRYRRRRLAPDATASGRAQLAAERGHWREGGSLVFHTAFYVLLVGAVIGKAFGFDGQINLPVGSAFADTRIAYDLAEPGRWFGLEDHRGFVVHLDDFTVEYYDNFVPADFVSRVRVSEGGEVVRDGTVRVNHPFVHDGIKLYQARFGMAPRVVVRAGETVLYDDTVMLGDAGGWIWTGAAKVSLGARGLTPSERRGPQIALDLVFLPDAALSEEGIPYSRSPEPRNPRLVAQLYVGEDMGLDRSLPASRFDRDAGSRVGPPAILPEGGSADVVPGQLSIEFSELAMWSGFQVSHAPGRWLLLVAAVLLLGGLIPSLYSYRRRIWVEAEADGDVTRVHLAGVALQRRPAFVDELDDLADALRDALGGQTPSGGPTAQAAAGHATDPQRDDPARGPQEREA